MSQPGGEGEAPCPPMSTVALDCVDCYGELRERMHTADIQYLHQKSQECMEGRQAPAHIYLKHARAAADEAVPRRSDFARFVPDGSGAARRSELATRIVAQRNYQTYRGKPLRGGGTISLQPLFPLPPVALHASAEDATDEVYFDDERFGGAEVVFLNGEPHRIANGQPSERALYGVDSPTAAIRAAAAKARSGAVAPSKKANAAAQLPKQSGKSRNGAAAKRQHASPSDAKGEGDYTSDQFYDYLSESGQRYRVFRLHDGELPPLTGGEASRASSRGRHAVEPEKKSAKERDSRSTKAVSRANDARKGRDAASRSTREGAASSPKKGQVREPKKPQGSAKVRRSGRHAEQGKHRRRSMSLSSANSSLPVSPTASASGSERERDDVDVRRRTGRDKRGREDRGHTSAGAERRLPPIKSGARRDPIPAPPSRQQARGQGDSVRDRTGRRRGRHQRAEKSELASPRSASSTSLSPDWASLSGSRDIKSNTSDCVVTDESRRSGRTQRSQARRRRHSVDTEEEEDEARIGTASKHDGSAASDEESLSSSSSLSSASSSPSSSGSSDGASLDRSSALSDSPAASPRGRRRHGDRGGRSTRAASRRSKVQRRRGTRDTEPLKASRDSSSDSAEGIYEQPDSPGAARSPGHRRRAHRSASASRPPVVTAVTAAPQAQGVLAPLMDELLPGMRYAPDGASPLSPQSPQRPPRDWRHAALGFLGPMEMAPQAQQLPIAPVTAPAAAAVNAEGHVGGDDAASPRPAQQALSPTTTNPLRRSYEELPLSPLQVSRFRRLSAVSSASSGPVCATPQEDGQHRAVSVHSRQSSRAAAAHTTTVPAEGLDLDLITEHVLRVLQRRIGGGGTGGHDVEALEARRAKLAAEAEAAAVREREAAAERERLRVLAEEEAAAAAAAAAAQAEAEAAVRREAAQRRVRHLLHEARDEMQLARDAELSMSSLTTSVAFTQSQVARLLDDGEDLDAVPLPLGLTRGAAGQDRDSELTMTNVAASSGTHIYGAGGPLETPAQRGTSDEGSGAAVTAEEAVLATLNAEAAALQRLVAELRQMRERRAEERRVAQAKAAEERRLALEKAAAEERAREAQRAKAAAEAKALQQARQRQYEMEALMADERRSRSCMLEDQEEAWDEVLVNAASQLDDVLHRIATRQRNARLSLCEEEADARAEIVGTEEDEVGDFWDVAAHLWQAAAEEAEARDEEERVRLEREAEAAMAAWREEQMAEAERMQAEVRRMEAEAQKSRGGSPAGAPRRSDSELRGMKRSNLIPGQIIGITGAKSIEGGGKIRLVGDPHVAAVEARARERRRADRLRQKRLSSAKATPNGVDRAPSGGSGVSSRPPSTVLMGIVGSAAGVAKPKNRVASRNSRLPSGYMLPHGENNRVGLPQPLRRQSQLQSRSNFVGEGDVDLEINGQQVGTPARSRSRASSLASARSAPMQGVDISIGVPYKIAPGHEVNTMDIQAISNY